MLSLVKLTLLTVAAIALGSTPLANARGLCHGDDSEPPTSTTISPSMATVVPTPIPTTPAPTTPAPTTPAPTTPAPTTPAPTTPAPTTPAPTTPAPTTPAPTTPAPTTPAPTTPAPTTPAPTTPAPTTTVPTPAPTVASVFQPFTIYSATYFGGNHVSFVAESDVCYVLPSCVSGNVHSMKWKSPSAEAGNIGLYDTNCESWYYMTTALGVGSDLGFSSDFDREIVTFLLQSKNGGPIKRTETLTCDVARSLRSSSSIGP